MRPCKRSPSCYQHSLSYSCQRAPAGLKLCIFQYALFVSAFLSPLNCHLFEKVQLVNQFFPLKLHHPNEAVEQKQMFDLFLVIL